MFSFYFLCFILVKRNEKPFRAIPRFSFLCCPIKFTFPYRAHFTVGVRFYSYFPHRERLAVRAFC